MALLAISKGVTGTAGFLSGVGADPVTAQEIIVDGIEGSLMMKVFQILKKGSGIWL